jgi:hypothetical protein
MSFALACLWSILALADGPPSHPLSHKGGLRDALELSAPLFLGIIRSRHKTLGITTSFTGVPNGGLQAHYLHPFSRVITSDVMFGGQAWYYPALTRTNGAVPIFLMMTGGFGLRLFPLVENPRALVVLTRFFIQPYHVIEPKLSKRISFETQYRPEVHVGVATHLKVFPWLVLEPSVLGLYGFVPWFLGAERLAPNLGFEAGLRALSPIWSGLQYALEFRYTQQSLETEKLQQSLQTFLLYFSFLLRI